jgi:Domain of unknown function (DUF4410)
VVRLELLISVNPWMTRCGSTQLNQPFIIPPQTKTNLVKKPTTNQKTMKNQTALNLCIVGCAINLFTGCASTKVTSHDRIVYEKLPKPDHILIYDFTATPADVPADSAFASQSSAPAAPPTSEEVELGQKLGATIAAQLANDIHELGLPATQVSTPPTLQVNDIVIRGYLVSIETGSAAKRMTLGFGSGGSELTTAVEAYQMTATGLRKLGSGTTGASSGKGPGAALGGAGWLITGNPVGLIVGGGMKIYGEASGSATIEGRAKATAREIADAMKVRFEEEGWIN